MDKRVGMIIHVLGNATITDHRPAFDKTWNLYPNSTSLLRLGFPLRKKYKLKNAISIIGCDFNLQDIDWNKNTCSLQQVLSLESEPGLPGQSSRIRPCAYGRFPHQTG